MPTCCSKSAAGSGRSAASLSGTVMAVVPGSGVAVRVRPEGSVGRRGFGTRSGASTATSAGAGEGDAVISRSVMRGEGAAFRSGTECVVDESASSQSGTP